MDIYDRLNLYKIALKDYKRANNPFKSLFKNKNWKQAEHAGFCHYFYTVHNYNFRHNPLKELYECRPNNIDNTSNWFPKGKDGIKDRIKCLKKAIKNTEKILEENILYDISF
ncbi:MAG: hypothetical protein ACOC3V_02895 [bacterium]